MSKVIPIWHGVVTSAGVLELGAQSLYENYLRRTLANNPIKLVISKLGRSKSRSQMGYIFGVLYPVLADHFGYMDYEIDAVHDACMRLLRGLRPDPNPLQLRVSLKEMSHEEVGDYIEDLRHWALTMHGCVTPDADKAVARSAA